MNRQTRALPLSAFSAKYQEQIVAQLHPKHAAGIAAKEVGKVLSDAPRLRQSGKGPNKTEAAFAAHVRACYPSSTIYEQGVTLVLANGLRYTPDIFHPGSGATRPAFYEVKGFMRDDASAKIKMAAEVHRWADFFLVTKRKKQAGGGWSIEVVLPLQR